MHKGIMTSCKKKIKKNKKKIKKNQNKTTSRLVQTLNISFTFQSKKQNVSVTLLHNVTFFPLFDKHTRDHSTIQVN